MFDKKKLMSATEKALLELIDSDELVSPGIEKMVKSKPEVQEKSKGLMEMLKLMGITGKESPEEEEMEESFEMPEMEMHGEDDEDEELDEAGKRKKAIMLAVMKK